MATNQVHRNQKPQIKFVVYGLIEIEPDTLKAAFNGQNLYPTRIVKMAMKRRTNDELQNYLLYFDCENVEQDQNSFLRVLQEVKSVDSFKVSWAKYENKRNGPPQCMNCLKFGHVRHQCTNSVVCFRCSEQHDSEACRHFFPNSKMVPKDKLKCYYCQGSHTALSIECEIRKQLIDEWNLANGADEEVQQEADSCSSDDNSLEGIQDNNNNQENEPSNEYNSYSINISPELQEMIMLKRTLRRRWQRTRDSRLKSELNRLQKEIKEELMKLRQQM